MPDQSSASSEHALIQEIAAPLANLPDHPMPEVAEVEFPIVLRGYDREAVDDYVKRTSQLVAELTATHSPQAAVRRALERVGEEVSGILQRAHETGERITADSRREAEDRLEVARREVETMLADARSEADATVGGAQRRLTELDAETDRIWAERQRIMEDTRSLSAQLQALSEAALARFPADEASHTDEHAVEELEETMVHPAMSEDEPLPEHQPVPSEEDTGEMTQAFDGEEVTAVHEAPFDAESSAPLPGEDSPTGELFEDEDEPSDDEPPDDELLEHDGE